MATNSRGEFVFLSPFQHPKLAVKMSVKKTVVAPFHHHLFPFPGRKDPANWMCHLFFICARERLLFTQRENFIVKVWEHLVVTCWRFVLFCKHFTLSYSGFRCQNVAVSPHTLASHGRCLYSPEAAVALASGQKYQIERHFSEKQFGLPLSACTFLFRFLFGC